MAATKTVLRVTNNKAIVRIVATAAADTATRPCAEPNETIIRSFSL